MKKSIIFAFSLFVLLTGVACSSNKSAEFKTLKEAAAYYHTSLTEIIEKGEKMPEDSNTPITNANAMISRADYLAIYETTKDTSQVLYLSEHLKNYSMLIGDLNNKLKTATDQTELTTKLSNLENINTDFKVFLAEDSSLIFEFTKTILGRLGEYEFQTRIKMGEQNEKLFIKEFAHGSKNNQYEYYEFNEASSIHEIQYSSQTEFSFRYTNLKTNEYVLLLKNTDIHMYPRTFQIWFNPKTNIRTTFEKTTYTRRALDLMNDHGTFFMYKDIENGPINLWFQLLEATNWDQAYAGIADQSLVGVYRNNTSIFSDTTYQFNTLYDPVNKIANVGVFIDATPETFTNELLSLGTYGLSFYENKLTVDFIQDTLNQALENSQNLFIYQGIDFQSGKTYQFIDKIDIDLFH